MSFNIQYNFKAIDKFTRVSNRVNKSVKRVQGRIRKLDKTMAKAGRGVAGFGRSLLKFRRILLAAAVTTGLVIAIKKITNAGIGFQDALAELSAITGITGKQLDNLAVSAKKMGLASITSSADVLTAFKLVASAKSELIKTEKGLETVTKQALLLKNAAGIDLVTSVNSLTTSLNQFQLPASQAAKVVNILAAGSKIGASEIFETSEAIIKSGAAAKLAGVDFATLNAAIQVLAKNGIKGVIAGTQLKTALLKLTTLGIDKANPKIVGFSTALNNLAAANLNAKQLMKIFGLEAIQAGSILINNARLVGKWDKALRGTNVAQEQAAIRLATFGKRISKLGIVIQNKLIDVFFRMEPQLIELTNSFGKFLDAITVDDIKRIAGAFGLVLKSISTILLATAKLIDAFNSLRGLTFKEFAIETKEKKERTEKFIAKLQQPPPVSENPAIRKFAAEIQGRKKRTDDFVKALKETAPVKTEPARGEEVSRVLFGQPPVSKSQIDVNINAPQGTVASVQNRSSGPTTFNLGQNIRRSPVVVS